MDTLVNVDRIETKNVLGLKLFLLFGVSFLIRMRQEVVFNDTSEGCIPYSSGYFFSTLDASIFFAVDEFGEAPTAKSMIARLNGDWYGHDFIAKRAGDLILDGLRELANDYFFLLLLFFLLFSSLLFFYLFLLFLFLFFLPFSIFLLFFLLLFLLHSLFVFPSRSQLYFESDGLTNRYLACSQQPYFIQMLQIDCISLPDFFAPQEGSIRTQIREGDFVCNFSDRAVFSTQALIADADVAFWVASDDDLIFREMVGGQGLSIRERDEPAPVFCIIQSESLCFFQ